MFILNNYVKKICEISLCDFIEFSDLETESDAKSMSFDFFMF